MGNLSKLPFNLLSLTLNKVWTEQILLIKKIWLHNSNNYNNNSNKCCYNSNSNSNSNNNNNNNNNKEKNNLGCNNKKNNLEFNNNNIWNNLQHLQPLRMVTCIEMSILSGCRCCRLFHILLLLNSKLFFLLLHPKLFFSLLFLEK